MNPLSLALVLGTALLAAAPPAASVPSGRSVVDLDAGWRFHLGDAPENAQPACDDSAWAQVDVPHDWSAAGPFTPGHGSGNGFAPGGVAWYRLHFRPEALAPGGHCQVIFDGVYDHAQVWLNGQYAGGRPYGYATFRLELAPFLRPGRDNVLAVRVDHSREADSRWYTGSGIYRHVRLCRTGPARLDPWDTVVTTPSVAAGEAKVRVRTRAYGPAGTPFALEAEVLAPDGARVASGSAEGTLAEDGAAAAPPDLTVAGPRLWSPDAPELYVLRTRLRLGGAVVDELSTPFGIRTAVFDPDRGFLLNGAPLKLKGVCLHHDAGCLGAAVPEQVLERRLRLLRDLGVNAVRTSHNPPAPEFLDLCDRLGLLVKEEAFDEFTPGKNKWVKGWNAGVASRFGYSESFGAWSVRDIQDMVRRDRNHPCVILWSIGNEIDYANDPFTHPALGRDYLPGNPRAELMVACARPLVAAVKALDPTRPVTSALANVTMSSAVGFPELLDAVGYNYQEARYLEDHRNHPSRVIFGSENGHSLEAWAAVRDNAFISGQFLWTGIDYLGEASAWPSRGSGAGLLDLCGFRKPLAWFRQSLWTTGPMVYACAAGPGGNLQESWNWPAGSTLQVTTYSTCGQVRLSLNGRDLGTRDTLGGPLVWTVPFQPGLLQAEGLRDGQVLSRYALATAGPAARLALAPEAGALKAGNREVCHVPFRIEDAQGRRVPGADLPLRFELTGPARILGLGNGDLTSAEAPAGPTHRAYQGQGLAILQTTGERGTVTLKVTGPGLEDGFARIEVR